jgi:hypothetical protein
MADIGVVELVTTTEDSSTSDAVRVRVGASEVASVSKLGAIDIIAGVTAYNATAVPAGGAAGKGYKLSSTSNLGLFFGSGAPTLAAAQGSLYIRTDGSSVSTRLYSNSDGGTTWVSMTSAS